MGEHDAKRLVLARRARFVAAALASAAAVAQGGACSPAPCLDPAPSPTPDASGLPEGGANDGSTPAVPDDDSGIPQPCLSTVPPDAESK